ncbi:hypothetical protein B0H15DRAFT_248057 [Mycena belliarum]|uniref:Thaumatin-like protein n=1 Tax=Mycena belliarum TaxID=1033014 RepID=A0AAD6XQ27_9AGAR|nr:hypothetical protein B0H15DRAFT_248057 [Mycena belliae]
MVFSPLVSTLLFLGVATIGQTSSIHGHGHAVHRHRGLAERVVVPIELSETRPTVSRTLHRRRSCHAPGTFSSSAATAASSTVDIVATAKTVPATTEQKTAAVEKTSTGTTVLTATTAAAGTATTSPSSSSGSGGGHQFTLVNKCSSAVKPMVVSTACGYSPRCAGAFSSALPSVGSLTAGQTTTINVPNNFVGRIFSQDGSCGAKGESCTMLEFNLDADSFYTPNSYDISNIQGFTQSIALGAAGCPTVTCTSPGCTCDNAYPIGDMTGCGSDLPVKACGKGNKAFTVVFCP